MEAPDKSQQYVSPFNPATLPRWGWAVFLGVLLFCIILAMYLINKPGGSNPAVIMKQSLATSGIMQMSGAV